MNAKGMKFLAVLAVLAMAFATVSVSTTWSGSDAAAITIEGQAAYTSAGITTDNIGEVAEGDTLTLTATNGKTLYRSMVIEYGASTSYGSTLEYFLDYEIEITNQGTTNNSVVITFTELGAAKISSQHVKVSGGSYTLVEQSTVMGSTVSGNYYLLTGGLTSPFGKVTNTSADVVIDINGIAILRSGNCYVFTQGEGNKLYITDNTGNGSIEPSDNTGAMFAVYSTSTLILDGLKYNLQSYNGYTPIRTNGGSVIFWNCDIDTTGNTGDFLLEAGSGEGSRTLEINGGSITGSGPISAWYHGSDYTIDVEFATSKAVDLEVTTSFTSDVDGFALGIWESQDYSGLTDYASSFVVWDGLSVTDELMDYTIFDGTVTITDTPTGECSYTITVYNGSVTYDGITYTGSTDDLSAPSFVLTIAQGEDETEPTVKYHVSGADYGITITKNSLATGRIGTTIANEETTNYIAVDFETLTVSGEENLTATTFNLQIVDGKIATGDGQELTSSETGTATEPALTVDASVTGETFSFDFSTMDGKMTVSLGRNETEETYLNPATLTADAQGGALVIEGDGEGNFEVSILRGTMTLGGTYDPDSSLTLTLYSGAAIVINDIPYRNNGDEEIQLSVTYGTPTSHLVLFATPVTNGGVAYALGEGDSTGYTAPFSVDGTEDLVFTVTAADEHSTPAFTVYINGIAAEAGTDYTVSDNVLTFTAEQITGDILIVYSDTYTSSNSSVGFFVNDDAVATVSYKVDAEDWTAYSDIFTATTSSQPVSFKVTPGEDYDWDADSLRVFIAGVLKTSGTDYTITEGEGDDEGSYIVSFTAVQNTGDIAVLYTPSAEGSEDGWNAPTLLSGTLDVIVEDVEPTSAEGVVIPEGATETITVVTESYDDSGTTRYETFSYSYTLVAATETEDAYIENITILEGDVTLTLNLSEGTEFTIAKGVSAVIGDILYYANEDTVFEVTEGGYIIKNGDVTLTFDAEETVTYDGITYSKGEGNEAYLNIVAVYTPAGDDTEESYDYSVTVVSGVIKAVGISDITEDDTVTISILGGELWNGNYTYSTLLGVKLTFAADDSLTVTDGTLIFESIVPGTTTVVVSKDAYIGAGEDLRMAVVDSIVTITSTLVGSDMTYSMDIASGKMISTLDEGDVLSIRGLTFTVQKDGTTIQTELDEGKTIITIKGDVDVAGIYTSDVTINMTGDLGITGTLTIQNGTWTNDVTITYVDENSKIIVKQGAAVSAKITCIKGITTAYATVSNLTAGTYTVEDVTYNEIQIYPGSVVITGPIASDDVITATNGTVVLDGVIIPAGTTLTVAKGASVVLEDVYILTDGALIIEGTASGEVVNEGTLTYGKEADVSELDVDGSGTIVDNRKNVMEDQEVSGDATKSHVYPANQRIIVRGSWTILKGADVTIKGELVVPEGTKLTVENGASLTISKANAEIYGTLVVDAGSNNVDDGAFTCYIGNVDIHGTVQSNGSFIVIGSSSQGGKVTLYEDAVFTVGADGGLAVTSEGNVTIKTGATLTIKGESAAETIYNYGTIVFDTLVPATGDSTVYQMANGAVVDIKNYTIGYAEEQATLTVTDSRLQFYVDKTTYGKGSYVYYITEDASYITDTDQTVNTIRDANTLVISSESVHEDFGSTISGLKIVEKVTSVESDDSEAEHYANGRIWTNTMDLSGDVKKSSAYVGTGSSSTTHTYKYYLDLDAKTASSVSETLKIASGISLTNGKTATSYMTVTGEFDASAWTSSVGIDNTNGVIKVKGLGIIKSRDLDGIVHAAKTEVNSTNKIYHFMAIDAMIAAVNADGSKIKEFEVVGTENYVTVTASIPKDVVMTVTGNVYIGESASDFETTLTIINGAEVKGSGTIEVYGTMYAENATNVKSSTEIISDIDVTQVDEKGKTIKDGWEKWTNIASALSGAQIGDVITVTKELDDGQYVRLYASAEVKYGVVLEIGDEAAPLWLANGVTLTVNGMFVTEQEVYAQSMFDLVAKNNVGDRSSAIVVNGEMHALFTTSYAYNAQSPSTDDDNAVSMKDGAPIAGAYYANDEYNVIAGIDTAMYDIEEIISEITINGKVTAGIVAFSATETCTKMKIGNDITNYETLFTVGTIVLDGTTLYGAGTGAMTGMVVVGDSAVVLEEVTGAFSFNEKDDKLIMSKTFAVPTKKHLEISEGIVYAGKDLAITGTDISVGADAILTANESSGSIANLTVDGILSVPNNKGITVTNLTVNGAVAVAEATASASQGNLTVTKMYIGMEAGDVTSAAAILSGPFTFNDYVLVYAGSAVDETAQAVLDKPGYSTEFYVEGKLWFTAYANGSSKTIKANLAPIDDAKLIGWNTEPDMSGTTITKATAITIGANDGLYAKINYDIYRVEIKSDAGIKEISLNGKLMKSPASGTNVFYLNDLRAGTYKVSYTLINGYEGTATLKTSEGTILQNNSFQLTGMDDDQLSGDYYVFEYQLNGTEPIPEPEPVTPEEQSEWTITTILLCVLVVLIAVMAVIVALRLMRN